MVKIATHHQQLSQHETPSNYPSALVKNAALSLLRNEFLTTPMNDFNLVRHALLKSKLNAQFMNAYENSNLGTLQLPPDFATRRLHQKAKAQRLSKALGEIVRILNSKHIPFLAIKGPALSIAAYGNIYAREFNDIDILVHPSDFGKADAVLKAAGLIQPLSHTSSIDYKDYEKYRKTEMAPFPIKSRPNSIQALPYFMLTGPSAIRVELHDSLYYLPRNVISGFFDNAINLTLPSGTTVRAPSLENQLLLLFSNTFENSESPYANLMADRIFLQDYCDIHYFLKANKDKLDWNVLHYSIASLANDKIISVIANNLSEVYDNRQDTHLLEAKLGIKPRRSSWGIGIMERAFNAELCKRNALQIEKSLLNDRKNKRAIYMTKKNGSHRIDTLESCTEEQGNLHFKYALLSKGNTLIVQWVIDGTLRAHMDDTALCVLLYPRSNKLPYLRISVNVTEQHGQIAGTTHTATNPYHRPILQNKESLHYHTLHEQETDGFIVFETKIPESIHKSANILQEELFATARIYKRVYQDIYHPIGTDCQLLFEAKPVIVV